MKKREGLENNAPGHEEEMDGRIYDALIERGWIIPQTEEEVKRAERALARVELPPLSPELADPYRLIHRLDEIKARESREPLTGILNAAKELGKSDDELVEETRLSHVLVTMFDLRQIKLSTTPQKIVERIASAIRKTVEQVTEYLSGGPRFAASANYRAEDAPALDEPQSFADAILDDPTLSDERREELLAIIEES
jgi:hypothetical protein